MKVKKGLLGMLALCMSVVTGFVGCGGSDGSDDGSGGGHTHTYNVRNATENYLKTVADCTDAAEYYYACECGEKGTETYTHGEALGHDYENGACGVCEYECTHAETEWKTDVAAGCITEGSKRLECKECGASMETEGVAATGHTFESGACKDCKADLWDGTADTSWYIAGATNYTIATAEQLAGLAQLVSGGNTFEGITFKMAVSMDLNGLEWSPIGTDTTNCFKGALDGSGLEIANMKITTAEGEYVGLFGCVSGATIKNLRLRNADISVEAKTIYVGCIAGLVTSHMVGVDSVVNCIEDCEVQGKIFVKNAASNTSYIHTCYAGGAFGAVLGQGVKNIYADCDVESVFTDENTSASWTAERYLGGFSGANYKVEGCVATGDVTAKEIRVKASNSATVYAGGFSGSANGQSCYASGNVSSEYASEIEHDEQHVESHSYLGGFGGYGAGTDCYSTGSVTSHNEQWVHAGGFSGRASSVTNCHSSATVSVTDAWVLEIGGLLGAVTDSYSSGKVSKCYATGDIYVSMEYGVDAGGLIGNGNAAVVEDSYATGDVTVALSSALCRTGGLVGCNFDYNLTGSIKRCYASGNVQATANDAAQPVSGAGHNCYVGGLVAFTNGTVEDCYTTGDVKGTAYTGSEAEMYLYAGGLIAYTENSTEHVLRTYTLGRVEIDIYATNGATFQGKWYAGGLIGSQNSSFKGVKNSFVLGGSKTSERFIAHTNSSSKNYSNCYASKTYTDENGETVEWSGSLSLVSGKIIETERFKQADFYFFLDETVWNIVDGEYPTLKGL